MILVERHANQLNFIKTFWNYNDVVEKFPYYSSKKTLSVKRIFSFEQFGEDIVEYLN